MVNDDGMAQAKSRPRLYIMLFFVAVFLLTSVGLAAFYYGMLPSSLLFILVYVMGWALLFAFGIDFFGGKDKFGGKKILVLVFGVMLVSTLFTHLIWTIVTPKWFFSVSTDKSVYELGELVTITASLRNMGFITHSFKSASNNPVFVWVEYFSVYPFWYHVWWSLYNRSVTEFSVGPSETLERNFSWNQTNIQRYIPQFWNQTLIPGTYRIYAVIPRETADESQFGFDNLFYSWTSINITST